MTSSDAAGRSWRFGFLALSLLAILAAGAIGLYIGRHDAPPMPDRAEFESWVKDYILDHPEVLREAILKLQAAEDRKTAERIAAAVAENREALIADPASPVAGNPVGDVTLVAFFDYKCPYCKRITPDLETLLGEDPGLRLVYKEFPILGPDSRLAALAALAAVRQNLYAPFHRALMAHKGPIDQSVIAGIAREIGLDPERLAADMAAPEIARQIDDVRKLAETLGIRSTPTFVIGKEVIAGALPLADMRALIARARSP